MIWAGVILLAVLLGVAAWNHWFSATRIAFVNYQATTLGQIARANDHARIRLASVEPSEFDRLGHYDVVLANIVADVIIPLSRVVPEFLQEDSVFICSGILNTRLAEVLAALEQNGLQIISTEQQEDWCRVTAALPEA